MPLHITASQIAVRLLLASIASLLLGLNRDEHGRPAGMRTTMLVTLAATLAMLEVNILLSMDGKPSNSFISLDVMRLPLGVLSGIGFIGAGTILKKEIPLSASLRRQRSGIPPCWASSSVPGNWCSALRPR